MRSILDQPPASQAAPTRAARRRIERRRAESFPLEDLPADMRAEIAAEVAAHTPPLRWFPVGAPDSRQPLAWLESRGWYEWHWSRGIDPLSRRDPLPLHLRLAVIARDGYVCQLCLGEVEPADVHIDHIKPYSKGGRHVLGNLQVTHSLCNLRKGAND